MAHFKEAGVRVEAAGVQYGVLAAVEVADLALQGLVQVLAKMGSWLSLEGGPAGQQDEGGRQVAGSGSSENNGRH